MKLKVLMVIDSAPDYRESFFRKLGEQCDLTVVAKSCNFCGLKAPLERKNYKYFEPETKKVSGFLWQSNLNGFFHNENWDVLCVGTNMRHIDRISVFIRNKKLRSKWIWRGQMYGKMSSNKVLFLFRSLLLNNSKAALTYNMTEMGSLRSVLNNNVEVESFNNSEVCIDEFRQPTFQNTSTLNLLFVGRNQPRKKLERLIRLAMNNKNINIRLIGPDMHKLIIPAQLVKEGRVVVYEGMRGSKLNEHFDWAHLVVNPGHLGLLVLNASRHGKPIVVDSSSNHAPEVEVAERSSQFFIDFSNETKVDSFFEHIVSNKNKLPERGFALQELAKKEYTIEYMVKAHMKIFEMVANVK